MRKEGRHLYMDTLRKEFVQCRCRDDTNRVRRITRPSIKPDEDEGAHFPFFPLASLLSFIAHFSPTTPSYTPAYPPLSSLPSIPSPQNGFGFETYEPDTVPTMIALEQRIRDTGNAFTNFNTQVLKMPTKYTEAFSGLRPKGASVGNWLERDPEYHTEAPASYQERIEAFRTGRDVFVIDTEDVTVPHCMLCRTGLILHAILHATQCRVSYCVLFYVL
jgi:hypothetical protein